MLAFYSAAGCGAGVAGGFLKPPIEKTESWYNFLDLKSRPKIRNLGIWALKLP
jgi:hypothetical protein